LPQIQAFMKLLSMKKTSSEADLYPDIDATY
jgi:hypothetical protein